LRYFSAVLPVADVLALVDRTSAIVYLGALSASAPVERDVGERTVAGSVRRRREAVARPVSAASNALGSLACIDVTGLSQVVEQHWWLSP
jgi:hypothetical protein